MKRVQILVFCLISVFFAFSQMVDDDPLGLASEYSADYFESGIRALHATRYELAISEFITSLGYKSDNSLSRLYLGEAYRKAGYERNALYTWNSLASMGYESRFLKGRIGYLYNRRGMLSDIYIDKNYIIRTEMKGYNEGAHFATFLNPSQIAVDRANNYYVCSFSTGEVVQLDANLNIQRTIMTVNPKMGKPFGVAVVGNGDLLVSDFENDQILRINQFNLVTQTIGSSGVGVGSLLGPEYLALDEFENLFVVDAGNVRINKYASDGTALFSFGDVGEGKLKSPAGLLCHEGEVFVVDKKLEEILVYDNSGNFLRRFGQGVLVKPYDITIDKLGRFLVSCAEHVWALEPDSNLWYVLDSMGSRLQRAVSLLCDNEDNIVISDFNRSTLYFMSLERRRYNNMFVNVERVISNKFPSVHVLASLKKDDLTVPVGLSDANISVYENGRRVGNAGLGYMSLLENRATVAVLIDNSPGAIRFKKEAALLVDKWMSSLKKDTRVGLVQAVDGVAINALPYGSTRLEMLDAISEMRGSLVSDKGDMFRKSMNDMSDAFSKKAVVLITDGSETGSDFDGFKIEDVVQFAINNDVKLYFVAFAEGPLSGVYRNMAKRSNGDYFDAYRRSDVKDLFHTIEEAASETFVVSYVSRSVSRFGREPIRVELEINYAGMKGLGDSIYFPPRK